MNPTSPESLDPQAATAADPIGTPLSLVGIEELNEIDGMGSAGGTHNCGGTFGTLSCPASVGTAFSFT
ncbi:hypothetical protein JL107_07685 [Nakamurella flavida]|uniref:Uncharacterized protein n=1 Tax=Nakamurella flavida TaxID=363630 RepID=A0A938YNI5_9ACTN|nr:hypothetical protein [Nakamurella flavida]MBM9476318.1 hypothetical protein [Nakamurella flavida]MDP9779581.1 hypothetical protein [Nakamurella flavida]